MICKNCNTSINSDTKFCHECGQKYPTHRIDGHHIMHDLIHAFVHADKGVFPLIKQIFTKPGFISREYVEGKRKKYYNPFSFIVLVTAISAFGVHYFQILEHVSDSSNSISTKITSIINKNINLIIFLNIPLLAFFSTLLFRKSGKNFFECLVLATYTSSARSVFFILVITPLTIFFPKFIYIIIGSYQFIWTLFFARSCKDFFQQKTSISFLKGFLVALLATISVQVIVFGVIITYFLLQK